MSSNDKVSLGALVWNPLHSKADGAKKGLQPLEQVISAWASFLSFGVVAATVFHYFLRLGNDKALYKTIVLICLLLCLGDTVVSGVWSYQWSSVNFGNSAALLATPKEAIATLLLFPTTALIVQLWFAYRLWAISMRQNTPFAGVAALFAIVSWAIAVWMFSAVVKRRSSLVDDFHRVFPVGYAWLVTGIITDSLIFGGLTYYTEFRSRKDRARHVLSLRNLRAIGHRMIECNVLPLLAQICLTVLISIKSNVGLYYMLSDMTLAKIYTFSLLVSLNARAPVLEAISSGSQQRSEAITFTRSRINTAAVQVRQDVHVTRHTDSDPNPPSPWQDKSDNYDSDKGVLVD
ncbi:hypothetical protein D9757_001637 [Collybiopsis confluens]|uniref:DUF6534 domain-containing protein n=1 Tax=Collybiopsis confluens TaxID=2823264 RepID=A0A8H5HYK0_9AGAR|nr:hypothetical protein D9757_001637 [Collybiopsis confluens]